MYKIKPLKYEYNALENIISSQTLFVHYNNHYKKYLDNLNKLLDEVNYDYSFTKEELVDNIDMFPLNKRGNILFNLGGVLNHELYFDTMGDKNHEIMDSFKEEIIKKYGSLDNFKEEFIKQAKLLVGSGYTFLVLNKEGELEIINTSNQETPISYGLIPIMNIDLWEHAYYLDYLNNKDSYINNFFSVLDYKAINEKFEEAKNIQKNL